MKRNYKHFPFFFRIKIQLKIMSSGLFWVALGIACIILLVTILMKQMHFVKEVHLSNIIAVYEIGFSLVAIFLYSQLFVEEIEEKILKWQKSTPLRFSLLLAERWIICTVILLMIYSMSLLLIHFCIIPLPWKSIYFNLLVPSFFLGHLSILATLVGRKMIAGIGLPLFYWTFENFTRGMLTNQLSLFQMTYPSVLVGIDWNRWMLAGIAMVFLVMGAYSITKIKY